jgi:hypothetical protein
MIRRGLRLKLVAAIGIALALPALSVVQAHAALAPTTTALSVGTLSGCAQPVTVTVTANGQPVTTGTVTVEDNLNGNQVQLANVTLNAQGTATTSVSLTAGPHSLTAVYAANSTYNTSTSSAQPTASVASPCEFTVSVSPGTLTLTAGQTGTVTASITPSADFTSTLSAPLFVTLSCSGLPDQSACTFTPENLEILPNATAPLTSTMVVVTDAQGTASAARPGSIHQRSNPVAWALLLPGALGLGSLAWGARRRRWFSRLSLMGVVAVVTVLGTTACNPQYDFYRHGPPVNPATPPGTYTVSVIAQSSNGIAAITNSTTLALTVQ